MASRVLRIAGYAVLGGLVAWWARLKAHSKVPPPEGRWREVADTELR